jgi:hypothetical protein
LPVRVTSRTLLVFILPILASTQALTACQRATPTPLPVARTLTHIASQHR